MKNILIVPAVFVLACHGLIHLMGATAYLKLGSVQGLAYKTTVLGGRLDLGEFGIGVFGALWALCAFGFISSVAGMLTNQNWWRPALLSVTLLSTALTLLDSSVAFIGVLVNFMILAWYFEPGFTHKSPLKSGG